ncbi:septation protein IspZ [Bradyrhizobium sp.]|uniref:septation protein IspZ n=1 Tax=Bradyrhizobium sp. TaxID=376 RepID=UPI001D6BE4FA|nr:septation protein IspZ [Bradyrhizobium sp.]MBV8700447.1 septation protein IspZ [Bradyrhizobium sp.]MBV8920549.1 septation protein IspZ [Bradyrhizobium sp.]MBV9978836.1 septation protein IspZ [Bradyrhizobium sp.]
MRDFLNAAKLLLLDLASTLLFVVVFLATHNTYLAIGLGAALGLAQIGTKLVRNKPINTMEWLSLLLLIAAGTATLLTDDPRFVLFKPSVIYAIVGVVMLKPGWMHRYLPAIAQAVVPDVAIAVGYLWAALMFVSAAVNAYVALTFGVATWALVMPAYGIISKVVVFLVGFATLRLIAGRRVHAMPEAVRDALLAATGRR